jgi:hypothetical protein
MLKEYLRSVKPSGPATRELPPVLVLADILLSVGVGYSFHKVLYGVIVFLVIAAILSLINYKRTSPRSNEEKLHADSYSAMKRLKYVLIDEDKSRSVVPDVLIALENAARVAMSAKEKLLQLPDSMTDIQKNALAFVDASMRLAIFAAKPCIRGDDQPRRDFVAICEDETLLKPILGKIQGRQSEIEEVEREVSQFQSNNNIGAYLRNALQERQRAEAELGDAGLELRG